MFHAVRFRLWAIPRIRGNSPKSAELSGRSAGAVRIRAVTGSRIARGRRRSVGDRTFEQTLVRLMNVDFAAGTEAFRDALLERCLIVLDADDEGARIDDSTMELLSAAGAGFEFDPNALKPHDVIGDNGGGSLPA